MMQRKWVHWTLAALVAVFMVGSAQPPKTEADAKPTGDQASESVAYQIPYRLTDTNHFLVRVKIDGKGPFNFLVDTGAPAFYVSEATAEAVGLEPKATEYWTRVEIVEFEGGAKLQDINARVEDPFQLTGMNALGLPGASIDGILGYTILGRYRITLDPTQDRMTWETTDFVPAEPFVPRDFAKRQQQMPADVQLMNALGPIAKGLALLTGKQPEEQVLLAGSLGLVFEGAQEDPAGDQEGPTLIVSRVWPGSPAARARLQKGDRITQVGKSNLPSLAQIREAMTSVQPGETVTLTYIRDGQRQTVELTAGGRL